MLIRNNNIHRVLFLAGLSSVLAIGCGDDGETVTPPGNDASVPSSTSTASGSASQSSSPSATQTATSPVNSSSPDGSAPTDDGGQTSSDAGSDASSDDASTPADGGDDTDASTPANDASVPPVGDAAACGSEGELCCASGGGMGFGGTCDDGLTCNNPQGNGLTDSVCEVPVAQPDAGSCGAEGEQCCASGGGMGFGGTCSDGLTCNNPQGNGLTDSVCEVPTAQPDAGADAGSCGAEGEQCCAAAGGGGMGGGGPTCNNGLTCNNGPTPGLSDSVCEPD